LSNQNTMESTDGRIDGDRLSSLLTLINIFRISAKEVTVNRCRVMGFLAILVLEIIDDKLSETLGFT